MNINGNDGPTLKKFFTCKGCKYLSKSTMGGKIGYKPYKCFHDSIIKNSNRFNIMIGDIDESQITPDFCPFLILKERKEKLKELKNL